MVAPLEEGKGQEPTQPEGETGKVPKKGMGAGKKWLIFLSIGIVVIAAVVVGIGFIPKTVYYACTTTQYYDCYQTEEYSCQTAYTCYQDEAYTTTSTVHLTYSATYSSDTDLSGDINVHCYVRNTDSVGGYFKVDFKATVEGMTGTATKNNQWISAGALSDISVQFPRSWFQSYSVEPPVVTAPTKTVQGVGTHSVAHTCYRADTCTRDVWTTNGCSQDVQSTCSYQDRLFW